MHRSLPYVIPKFGTLKVMWWHYWYSIGLAIYRSRVQVSWLDTIA